MHFFFKLVFLAFFCLPANSFPRQPGSEYRITRKQEASNFTDYIYTYFRGEGLVDGEQVYFAISNNNDPSSWTPLNHEKPVLISDVGTKGIRDPTLIINQDRTKYWLINTDLHVNGIGWNSGTCFTCAGTRDIIVWESTDLINWTGPSQPIVGPEDAGMTWAPDAIWDPEREMYMVFWTTKVDAILQTYRAWTSDFETFTPSEPYVHLGMDNTIAFDKSSGNYYMISKNGPGDLIQQSVSKSLDGPWTKVADQIGQGSMPAGEGPLIFQNNINPAKWHLWIDDYTRGGGYIPFETEDLASGKWAPSRGYKLPQNPRHGYVVPITAEERAALVAAYS